jgi:hypothetical protein
MFFFYIIQLSFAFFDSPSYCYSPLHIAWLSFSRYSPISSISSLRYYYILCVVLLSISRYYCWCVVIR